MFKTKPYKYQEKIIFDAYHSFLSHGHHAFLVEMGLGKTLMSLYASELLQRRGELDSIIIVPPKALIDVWVDEIPKHTYFEDNFYFWKNAKPIEKTAGPFPIIYINVEAFSRKNKYLKTFLIRHFSNHKTIVICDESTKIKNPQAQRTKNILEYTKDAKYKAILTGTEVTTSLLDLYTQYEFLKKEFWNLPNYWLFRSKYADLENIHIPGRKPFKKVVGFKRIGELHSTISYCTSRAKKKDCLDLPEKIYQNIHLEMNPTQARLYDELKQNLLIEYKDQVLTVQAKVALFIRFRQIAGGFMPESGELLGKENIKLNFIMEDSEEYKGKIIIWSCFEAEIAYIHKILGYQSVRYTGKESDKQKALAVDCFKNNPDIKYFIANPQSAAFGLNLQFCELVYYYSRTLSPELDAQSQDRCHRIGSKNKILYKYVQFKNSIDMRIATLLNNRQDLRNSFSEGTIQDIFKVI